MAFCAYFRVSKTRAAKQKAKNDDNGGKLWPKAPFSCNATRVLLDFPGFWVPWGAKNNKKTTQKTKHPKRLPKTDFFEKESEN